MERENFFQRIHSRFAVTRSQWADVTGIQFVAGPPARKRVDELIEGEGKFHAVDFAESIGAAECSRASEEAGPCWVQAADAFKDRGA